MVEKSESAQGAFGAAVKAAAERTRTGKQLDIPLSSVSHGHEADVPDGDGRWPAHLLLEGKNLAAGETPPALG